MSSYPLKNQIQVVALFPIFILLSFIFLFSFIFFLSFFSYFIFLSYCVSYNLRYVKGSDANSHLFFNDNNVSISPVKMSLTFV